MKRLGRRAFLFLLALPAAASANSVASVVVLGNGDVVFSDYTRNCIWRLDAEGKLSVLVPDKHTHHLVAGAGGDLWGEHVPMSGGTASLWRLPAGGSLEDAFLATPRGRAMGYRGTVFALGSDGALYYVQDCQILKAPPGGELVAMAGRPCPGEFRNNSVLRYGHLHGSLAWAPDGALLFSDTRTIRRVGGRGDVTTLAGKPAALFDDPHGDELAFDRLMGLAVDEKGFVYAADRGRREIVRFGPDGKPATFARLPALRAPIGLAVCGGDVYVISELFIAVPRFLAGPAGNPAVHKILADGRVTTLAKVR